MPVPNLIKSARPVRLTIQRGEGEGGLITEIHPPVPSFVPEMVKALRQAGFNVTHEELHWLGVLEAD